MFRLEGPNARGKGRPRGLAEAQKLQSVPLTKKLGWGEKEQPMSAREICLAAECLTVACPDSLRVRAEILPHAHAPAQHATSRLGIDV